MRAGWMGQYAARDPRLARLLSGQPGWTRLRDMDLFEAVQAFSADQGEEGRVGLGRSYLALAELFDGLDRAFLDAEAAYLAGQPSDAARIRLGFVALRQGDLDRADRALGDEAPAGLGYPWVLGRAGLAAARGEDAAARRLLAGAPTPAAAAHRLLGEAAGHLWGLPGPGGGSGPFGQALGGFRRGDLVGGVLALQMVAFRVGTGPGPDLFLYPLLRQGFAALASAAFPEGAAPYWAGRAAALAGDVEAALERYRAAAAGKADGPAVWLFSPVVSTVEAGRLARVMAGAEQVRRGRVAAGVEAWKAVATVRSPGPLVLAALAAVQAEAGLPEPLGDPRVAARSAVAAVRRGRDAVAAGGDELLPDLYAARAAAVAVWAARALARPGGDLEVLEVGHRKALGYRPDFVNPPRFLAALAGAYARNGRYASAVAVLFRLAEDYPSARLVYESVKRLYASRSGGGAPPR